MPTSFDRSEYSLGRSIPNAFNFEINRLATYTHWPHSHKVFASDLAKTGFRSTGNGDVVECVFCKLLHENWQQGQKPEAIHRSNSPHCPIFSGGIHGNQAAPNIPVNVPLPRFRARCHFSLADPLHILLNNFRQVQENGSTGCIRESGAVEEDHDIVPPFPGVVMRPAGASARNRPANSLRLTGIPTAADGSVAFTARVIPEDSMAVYPAFACHLMRKNSFQHQSFPQRGARRTRLFWEAGFFYTGYQDIVVCHFCGLNLYRWLHGEDPAIAHARWRPYCHYLINWRGMEFIHRVQRDLGLGFGAAGAGQ